METANFVANLATLAGFVYVAAWLRAVDKRNTVLSEAVGLAAAQLLRLADNAASHAADVAHDLAASHDRADAIPDGYPGEAADASARSEP